MKRIIVTAAAAWILSLPVSAVSAPVSKTLEKALAEHGPEQRLPVIVRFADRVDPRTLMESKPARRRERLINELKLRSERTQAPLQAFLRAQGAGKIKPLWLINGMSLTLPARVVKQLAAQPGVESVTLDGTLSISPTTPGAAAPATWNLSMIGAEQLWQQGYSGQGVVVASMDTGVDALHPDLAVRWRGGSNSWFDPNGQHTTPYDAHGHGTQTMGLMVGGDAGGSAIGVAPGAQWIAAKIFNDAGVASYSSIHLAYQWVLDPDGNPAVDDAPQVVSNAWGLVDATGSCITEFQPDVDMLRAAGIAVAYSAGNAGPASSTSVTPANYAGNLSAGAVDDLQAVAMFSSRGPSACDGTLFPTLAAPGVNVHTADLTFGGLIPYAYIDVTGTSFAAAHVAGGIALLKSALPQASASSIETALRDTSRDLGTPGPDNDSGHGLMDLVLAHQLLTQMTSPGTLNFTAENYSVTEDGVEARISVTRSGGSSGAVAIAYSTADGTALAGSDYLPAAGVLTFADGETAQSIVVSLVDDTLHEPDEGLTLSLANPTGGATLGWPASAVLTITDNDKVSGDADGDGYTVVDDCNDNDAAVHPGAAEIKHDGVDQDCNGFDLTIDIRKAQYDVRRRILMVQATSALGNKAALQLVGYGPMRWNRAARNWALNVPHVVIDPGTITVRGVEGAERRATVRR